MIKMRNFICMFYHKICWGKKKRTPKIWRNQTQAKEFLLDTREVERKQKASQGLPPSIAENAQD